MKLTATLNAAARKSMEEDVDAAAVETHKPWSGGIWGVNWISPFTQLVIWAMSVTKMHKKLQILEEGIYNYIAMYENM